MTGGHRVRRHSQRAPGYNERPEHWLGESALIMVRDEVARGSDFLETLYCVTVNWNLPRDTAACVESLLSAGLPPGQIIIVDNSSTDDSVAMLRARFGPSAHILEAAVNRGYADGCNTGILRALSLGAERVLLLNNDTVVAQDFFAELEAAVVADSSIPILAPLILDYDVPETIWYLGDRRIDGLPISMSLRRGRLVPGELPQLVAVDFVSGCAMMVERRVFEEIGVFDAGFFMYAEDVDFCWRARSAGLRLACATRARMWHKVSRSAGRSNPRSVYLRVRNQIWFYRMHTPVSRLPVLVGFTLARTLRKSLEVALGGNPRLIVSLWQALVDGWLDPMPKGAGVE